MYIFIYIHVYLFIVPKDKRQTISLCNVGEFLYKIMHVEIFWFLLLPESNFTSGVWLYYFNILFLFLLFILFYLSVLSSWFHACMYLCFFQFQFFFNVMMFFCFLCFCYIYGLFLFIIIILVFFSLVCSEGVNKSN